MLNKILSIGLIDLASSYEVKKIRVLNLACFIGFFGSITFLVIDLVMFPDDIIKIMTLIVGACLLLVCYSLQWRGQYFAARMLFMVLMFTIFFLHANYAFKGFYGEYFYLTIPIMALFFFEKNWVHFSFLMLALISFYVPNYLFKIYPETYFGYSNVGLLFIAIFFMVRYFKTLNQKSEQALAEQKELAVGLIKQKMLQSQLNPHFIFNALEVIQRDVLRSKPEDASVNLAKFSKLMRNTLEHTRMEFILLEDEIDALKNYVSTYELTLQYPIRFIVTHDLDANAISIPPMFIQPFIENALEHGMKNKSEGVIKLDLKKYSNFLQVMIEDNGVGLDANSKNKHQSLATLITRQRLDILNAPSPKKFEFQRRNILSKKGEVMGVSVVLTIPYQEI